MNALAQPAPAVTANEKRALLAERLRRAVAEESRQPLSFAQQRLWFLDQLVPNSPLYNVPVAARLIGPLNPSALEKALQQIVARHDALRTRFECSDGAPMQVVSPRAEINLRVVEAANPGEAERWIREEVRRPFNLMGGEPLLRAALVRVKTDEHLLALNLHHIVADEWSLKILFRELEEFYSAAVEARDAKLPALAIHYADHAAWQRERLAGEPLKKELAYWKTQLEGKPPVTELLTDRPRRGEATFEGRTLSRKLDGDLAPRLKALAAEKEATLFMIALAAFNTLIHRYTGLEDVIVGAPAAGRNRVETEGLIGFFVNTLLLRSNLAGDPTFEDLLRRVRAAALGAYGHQDAPFEKVVEALRPERDPGCLAFTKIMFALQDWSNSSLTLPGLKVEGLEIDTGTSKFDLTFVVQDLGRELALRVEYNSNLFAQETMERLLGHFENLLRGIVANPAQRLSELPMLGEAECRQLLVDWNATATDYPRNQCIQELFEARVAEHPDTVALVFAGETMTYAQLNTRANQLAHWLLDQNLKAGTPVAVCMEPSAWTVAALLAILKAGGAYVPLDPRYPMERLAFMLEDARTPILLTQKSLLPRLPRSGLNIIGLDSGDKRLKGNRANNPPNRNTPDDLAYIIYTSGSTGRPKGVAVPHRGVTRLVLNTNYIKLDATDRIAQVSNISFDAATFEIWGALLNGGQLRGIGPDMTLSPADFARELREQGITAMFLTSGLFSQLAAEAPGAFATMRTLIAGGEALDPKWVRAVLKDRPPLRLVNGYGPTENTTFTCCATLAEVPEGASSVPIGRPISNTQVYILDAHRRPVPVGVPGELYACGDGLARGYWNRPELTAEKFVAHRFSADAPAQVLYRTGDLARYLPDGNIEFLGRIDNQVKIRGFRIELGEIEAVLGRHPEVRECAVKVWGSGAGQTRLAAYVVGERGRAPKPAELRSFLSDRLPSYMVPAAFVPLEAMPLTRNGKVDRRALPDPDRGRSSEEKKYASPRDAIESELAGIWEAVLGITPVGIEDDFFELGGHSLMAVQLAARIAKALGKEMLVARIFAAPTIEKLAAVIRGQLAAGAEPTTVVELQPKGNRPPLFLVHGAGGGMFWGYVNLARRLGTDQPVYGLAPCGSDGKAGAVTVEGMAARYVKDLRRVQPRGPYYLGGYCFGGNLAYEMARQLESQGETVALLALMNCAPPNSRYMRARWTPSWCARLARNLIYWLDYCRQWTPTQRRDFARWKWTRLKHWLSGLSAAASPRNGTLVETESLIDLSSIPEDEQGLWKTHVRALVDFHPKPYGGRVQLIRSPGHPLWCSFDPDYGWGELAQKGAAISIVQGAHEKILEEPWVEETAAALKASLDQSLLAEWNRTEKEWPRQKTLIDLFDEQVARSPQTEALVCGGRRFTYRELSQHATGVAKRVRAAAAADEALVGICMERSEEMVAGILGTLRAGGAYVPLDPAYPADRLAFIAEDAGLRVVLTTRKSRHLLPPTKAQVLCVEDCLADDGPPLPGNLARPENLAYVLFTSGSTGRPKGVAIEHHSAVALVSWAKDVFSLDEISGVLLATSICFDLSVFELFVPLCLGGKVILADNALALPTLPAANEVTLINTVPSAIRELLRLKAVPASVRVVNLAGEPLPTPVVDQIYAETSARKVYDLYGPTETTTYSTFALRQAGAPATIGRPLANEQVYILDAQMRTVPLGEPGDLYIAGAGLARGYLHRPDLTAERFLANPFQPGERLYKTGDIARWRGDGNLIFMGRADHQVKIRGFRVELGEIESAIRGHSGVADVVVIAREDRPGEKRLAAYVVAKPETQLTAGEMRAATKAKLPEYMVPAFVTFLPKLPMTPNGKVDRAALPAPQEEERSAGDGFAAPQTEMEKQVAAIWGEVLGLNQVGTTDNFFELGGHSLSAIQVISRLRTSFKFELPLSCLFDEPTVKALAQGLESNRWNAGGNSAPPMQRIPREGSLPASFMQEQLWFLHQLEPESDAYNVPVAIRLKGPLNLAALQGSLDKIVQRHEALRTTFSLSDGELRQNVAPSLSVKIEVAEMRGESEERLLERLQAEERRPFDLARGPLVRATLARVGDLDHALVIVMHHAVSDGWSLDVLFRELEANYKTLSAGRPAPELAALPIQQADYSQWGRRWMRGGVLEKELAYWREKLAGAPKALSLPADEIAPEVKAGAARAGRRAIELPETLRKEINKLARAEGGTPFIVLLTALAITLRKWTGQTDMVLGTVVAGRNREEIEGLIGCFMNFLPLRLGIGESQSGLDALRAVKVEVIRGQAHQDCPFEKIVESVAVDRRPGGNPLYNAALVFQNAPVLPQFGGGLDCAPIGLYPSAPLLDLRFEANEKSAGIEFACEFKTSLFQPESIDHLLASFSGAIEMLMRSPEAKIADFALVALKDAPPKVQLQTIAISGTFTAEPVEEPLRFWLDELGVAAEVKFAPFQQVFQQLLDASSVLATNRDGMNVLLARQEDWESPASNADEFVRAIQTAAGRDGAPMLVCFCPPSRKVTSDATRLQTLTQLENATATSLQGINGIYVVTTAELSARYPVKDYADPLADELGHIPYTPVFFTALATMIARKFHALRRPDFKVVAVDCDQTLWSGVCGEDGPKGIRIDSQRLALQEFLLRQREAGKLLVICSKNDEADVDAVFAQGPDMPLKRAHISASRVNWEPKSANLKAIARELKLGLDSFIFIDDNPLECAEVEANCPEVLTLQLPEDPAGIPQFLDHCWAFDQLKTTSEDRGRAESYQRERQREELQAKAMNFADFIAELGLEVQISPALPSQLPRVAQLTQRTNQFNASGRRRDESEMKRLGPRQEVLTVSVKDRFGDYGLVGAMIFETAGDAIVADSFLLSCRALGRGVEHQMLASLGKIGRERGALWVDIPFERLPRNRPALDFLESVGASEGSQKLHLPTEAAARVAFDPQRTASATAKETGSTDSAPPPSSWKLDKFAKYRSVALELDDAAKIQQRIEARCGLRPAAETGYAAPRNPMERQLCELWQKVLRIERVGINDDFFDLGGHSLLAVRLFAEVEKMTGRKLPLVTLFQAPTIAHLAALLGQEQASGLEASLVPIQPSGNKPPLYLVHGAGGDVLWGYANLVPYMDPDQPIFALKSRGQTGAPEFEKIEDMAAYYVQVVRASQPEGPYYLGGYCFGGNVAYEMARQLQADGSRVGLLALLDTAPSNAGYETVEWWKPQFIGLFARNVGYWLEDFQTVKPADRWRFVGRKVRTFGRKLARWARGSAEQPEVDLEEVIDPAHFSRDELQLWDIHLRALASHVQQPYASSVTLFRTRGHPLLCSFARDLRWGGLARGGVTVNLIPGSHESIFMEPNVKFLAEELTAALSQNQDQSTPQNKTTAVPL